MNKKIPEDRINILYVNSTPELGGANIQLIEIVKNLDLKIFRPLIINPPQKVFRNADFGQFGEPVYSMRLGVIKRSRNPLTILNFFVETVIAVPRLVALMRRERIAIVHANTSTVISSALAAKVCGVPVVWHIHEILSRAIVRRFLCRLILSLSDRVVTISKAVRDQFPPESRAAIEVVYDGIDINKLRPVKEAEKNEIRRQLGIAGHGPLIGMVGRFVPWKGQATFIRACAGIRDEFPDASFVLAGQTFVELAGYMERLEKQARELKLDDCLSFKFWCDDSARLMSALDVFVHASERPEPFGLVVIEAMALEKPVIGTVGGVREIIAPENGLLIRPGCAEDITAAVGSLLKDRKRAKEMGIKGRHRVKQLFSSRLAADRFTHVYRELLGYSIKGAA